MISEKNSMPIEAKSGAMKEVTSPTHNEVLDSLTQNTKSNNLSYRFKSIAGNTLVDIQEAISITKLTKEEINSLLYMGLESFSVKGKQMFIDTELIKFKRLKRLRSIRTRIRENVVNSQVQKDIKVS